MKRQKRKDGPERITQTVSGSWTLMDYLLANFQGYSRNHKKAALKGGSVIVNGSVVTHHRHPLKDNDMISIAWSPTVQKINFEGMDILYEDDEFIVINKESGLLSIATDKGEDVTAYRQLSRYLRMADDRSRIYILHRLDRETSGVMVFSKNQKLRDALQNNWEELVTQREYIGIGEGELYPTSGTLVSWLKDGKNHKVVSSKIEGQGLKAITEYSVLGTKLPYAKVQFRLRTGRKNQIRVQMQEIGHSIAGDRKYGAKTDPIGRVALHAVRIEFIHPFSSKKYVFECEPPKSMNRLVP